MSTLSDEYIKNFSKERKAIFNKRFSDDYDPNMSERSNIIRILNEMRELGLADGGRIGLREGLGSFETSDPKEAMREVIKRFLERNTTTVPITENIFLNLAPGVSDVELGGIMKILGGELGFGASKDKGIGFNFKKEFNKGGRVAYQEGSGYEPFAKTTLDINPNQTVEIPSRIKSDFDKKTSQAYDIGRFIGGQNLKPDQLGIVQAYAENPDMFSTFDRGIFSLSEEPVKGPFDKQGYSSDIRHGLGSSALKDQVIDFLGSNLNLDKSGKLLDLIGSGAVNVGSLFEEGKDILSSAKSYAERYPGLTGIQDYDYVPDNKYLTQPIEDIVANYVGSKVPFNMNIRDKLAFLTNYKKYGKQTLDQIKNIKEKRMQEKIRKAEAEQAREQARVNATKAMAEKNRARGEGGFQSNFAQDRDFMSGKGTAAEMGSFAKGGLARMLGE